MTTSEMGRFWDQRAREDAFYFINNGLTYGDPDVDRFWESGRTDLDAILGLLELEIDPDEDIVEIGCGVGRITRELAARARSVRALDASGEMVDRAREHNAELASVEWLHGDGSSLRPIADASADGCFSYVVFQHIPDPEVTLGYVREIGRVLRPGGWAAFQVSNAPEIHARRPLGERLRTRARAAIGRGPRGVGDPSWLGSAIALDDLERVTNQAGMTIERTFGEGTQFCLVLLRRNARPADHA